MDELGEKLGAILNDPESMERVRSMAESLLSGSKEEHVAPAASGGLSALLGDGLPEGFDLQRVLALMSKFKSSGDDDRSRLLLALRPHLSEPRKEKLDTAIKILRIIDLLPFIKESGILNL